MVIFLGGGSRASDEKDFGYVSDREISRRIILDGEKPVMEQKLEVESGTGLKSGGAHENGYDGIEQVNVILFLK